MTQPLFQFKTFANSKMSKVCVCDHFIQVQTGTIVPCLKKKKKGPIIRLLMRFHFLTVREIAPSIELKMQQQQQKNMGIILRDSLILGNEDTSLETVFFLSWVVGTLALPIEL